MINVMIVDDEERVRTGIKSLINWQEHNICIVAEACDGLEALELLEHHQVDILLTDIRMPKIDGLSLIENVRERFPRIKSIIMSGYTEFKYARKALTLGASDYLLKPSRRQEILEAVLKSAEELHKEKEQLVRLERLKEGFRESLPLLREKALSRIILTNDVPYKQLLESLEMIGLYFPFPFFGIVKIQIDSYFADQDHYLTLGSELLKFCLKNISEETFSSESCYCIAFENQDDIFAVLNCEDIQNATQLLPLAEKLKINAQEYLNLSISIGIGNIDKKINQLRNTYIFATNVLDSKFFIGPGKIINYEENFDDKSNESSYPIELERTILQAIISGESVNIKEGLYIFHQFLYDANNSKEDILKFSFSLYFSLYRLCIDKYLDVNEIFNHGLEKITQKFSRSNIETIYSELLNTSLKISILLNDKKQSNKLFESILDYIRNNYDKDINRETVANKVFISPGYLSFLFKQQLRSSFLDFLHQFRIEKACLLLKDQSKRVADIALLVGYKDEKYFFQVFKKYMGMTPKQYRNTIN